MIDGHDEYKNHQDDLREIEDLKRGIRVLQEDNTRLVKLLFLHRRFHNKVGCPGPEECYVCKEDNE